MDNYPLVSIVTPAYNQANYLRETLDSVLAQDYPNIEYIVLNDGSTDETSTILKRYRGKIYYENQENSGQASTINRGLSLSKGQFIGYLSSDDRLKKNAISELVKVLTSRPEIIVAYCDFDLIDTNSNFIRRIKTEDYSKIRLTQDLICQPGPGALFRREAFIRTKGWNTNLKQVPDFDFWLRVSKIGNFKRIPESLADYRIHSESASVRPISEDRANEIIQATKTFWGDDNKSEANIAISNAYFISAKHHLNSNRYTLALKAIGTGLSKNPKSILSKKIFKLIISGFLRKHYYKIKSYTQR